MAMLAWHLSLDQGRASRLGSKVEKSEPGDCKLNQGQRQGREQGKKRQPVAAFFRFMG